MGAAAGETAGNSLGNLIEGKSATPNLLQSGGAYAAGKVGSDYIADMSSMASTAYAKGGEVEDYLDKKKEEK